MGLFEELVQEHGEYEWYSPLPGTPEFNAVPSGWSILRFADGHVEYTDENGELVEEGSWLTELFDGLGDIVSDGPSIFKEWNDIFNPQKPKKAAAPSQMPTPNSNPAIPGWVWAVGAGLGALAVGGLVVAASRPANHGQKMRGV